MNWVFARKLLVIWFRNWVLVERIELSDDGIVGRFCARDKSGSEG